MTASFLTSSLIVMLALSPEPTLERVRQSPELASDPAAIDELVRQADAAPPGPARVESWVVAAEAYANRLGRPADAERLYRKIVASPHADPVIVRKASRDLVDVLLARGDRAGAAEAATGDPALEGDVTRAVRLHRAHLASIASLALLALLAGRALVIDRGKRAKPALRRIAPLAAAYALYVAAGGGLLAAGYAAGTARPFLLFGAAIFPLLLLARAWGAAGGATRASRAARAVVCAAGALAAAFLVLESSGR